MYCVTVAGDRFSLSFRVLARYTGDATPAYLPYALDVPTALAPFAALNELPCLERLDAPRRAGHRAYALHTAALDVAGQRLVHKDLRSVSRLPLPYSPYVTFGHICGWYLA